MSLKQKILELRNQNKTYDEIRDLLNCSKGTVSYHCGTGQRQKNVIRQRKHRNTLHPFKRKLENFLRNITKTNHQRKPSSSIRRLLQLKIQTFHSVRGSNMNTYQPVTFSIEDVINKFGEYPKCALTGEIIDIYKPSTYAFDHIIPVSRGGQNTLDNLQLLTKKANQAKHNLTDEEFIELCRKVISYRT